MCCGGWQRWRRWRNKYVSKEENQTWNGADGHTGWSDVGIESPTVVPFKKPHYVVNDYKILIQKYLHLSSYVLRTSAQDKFLSSMDPVSYTHLTLPTIYSV